MSRKNKKGRWQEFQLARQNRLPDIPIQHHTKPETRPKKALSRCAFCGRLLGVSTFHYVWDEFGQQVKKCNDGWTCRRRRKTAAEKAYRRAMKINAEHGRKPYWKEADELEEE